jgi:hypothetical protein
MIHTRTAVLAVTAAVTVAGLAGCGTDREDVAAAKCNLPVREAIGVTDDSVHTDRYGTSVDDLGDGRYRVTGQMVLDTKITDYVCELAPDPTDKLRGFKVTLLQTTPGAGSVTG